MYKALSNLLDRMERDPTAGKRWEPIDWTLFPTAPDAGKFRRLLEELAHSGVVDLKFGTRGLRDTIQKVSICDATAIYKLLGRTPAAETAVAAIAPLRERAEPWEGDILDEIESLWATNRQWQKIAVSNAKDLLDVQKLAQAINAGTHLNLDFRTFSARVVGDSKMAERSEASVLAYLRRKGENGPARFREIMAAHGSQKITMPVLLSGPVSLKGIRIDDVMDYVGIPVHELGNLVIDEDIEYVLSVENLTSFHRHSVETNPLPRRGLVLFTSGQPSHAFKEFYSSLVKRLSGKVPFYHWSDIDGGGLEITKVMMDLNLDVLPHLMDVDILDRYGTQSERIIENSHPFQGWLKPLAEYLARQETKVLEQEVIDPRLPSMSSQQIGAPASNLGA